MPGGCGGSSTGPAERPTSLRIVSGGSSVDSIGSFLREPLAVLVADANGKPVAGEVVSFAIRLVNSAYLTREGSSNLLNAIVDTTDGNGRAAAMVRFGLSVGQVSVTVRTSSRDLADSAHYTVTPGAATKILLSQYDAVAYLGASFRLLAVAADRGGNSRSADATFSLASGPGRVDPGTGAVTLTDFGRMAIAVRSGTVVDTSWVSVVPRARVAAQLHNPTNGGPIGIFLVELDGSTSTPLAAGIDNAWVSGQGFGWSPDGQSLAIARGDSVDLVSPGSPERRLLGGQGAVLLGARFSRDGQWIYFARAGKGIFRVHPHGAGEEQLGRGATLFGDDYRPAPSFDGRQVVYGSSRTPCGVTDCIRVLDIATAAERILVSGTNAAWSPTSDVIAYASSSGVGLIHADGTGQRLLATDVKNVGWMDWSPDGRWLVVSPGIGPVILFDTTNGARLPLTPFSSYGAAAWRPN